MGAPRVRVLIALACVWIFSLSSRAEPPYSVHITNSHGARDLPAADKAWRLYELACMENRRLKWDECLAVRAIKRARQLVESGYFEHRDPRTGQNEAWALVESCHRCVHAGENLTRGYQSPEEIHEALMKSPEHRRNILNSRFQFLGVGCHDYICVQLFAGY